MIQFKLEVMPRGEEFVIMGKSRVAGSFYMSEVCISTDYDLAKIYGTRKEAKSAILDILLEQMK